MKCPDFTEEANWLLRLLGGLHVGDDIREFFSPDEILLTARSMKKAFMRGYVAHMAEKASQHESQQANR